MFQGVCLPVSYTSSADWWTHTPWHVSWLTHLMCLPVKSQNKTCLAKQLMLHLLAQWLLQKTFAAKKNNSWKRVKPFAILSSPSQSARLSSVIAPIFCIAVRRLFSPSLGCIQHFPTCTAAYCKGTVLHRDGFVHTSQLHPVTASFTAFLFTKKMGMLILSAQWESTVWYGGDLLLEWLFSLKKNNNLLPLGFVFFPHFDLLLLAYFE